MCSRKWRPTTRLPMSRPCTSGKTVSTVSISSRRTSASSVLRSRFPAMPPPATAGSEVEEVLPAMGQRRQRLTDALLLAEVHVGHHHALAVAGAGEDDAPRIHHHRVPVTGVAGRVKAALARGQDVDLVLDGPRAD